MYPLQTYGEPVDEKAPIELLRLLKEGRTAPRGKLPFIHYVDDVHALVGEWVCIFVLLFSCIGISLRDACPSRIIQE